jgi:hypothetical protein
MQRKQQLSHREKLAAEETLRKNEIKWVLREPLPQLKVQRVTQERVTQATNESEIVPDAPLFRTGRRSFGGFNASVDAALDEI